MAEEEEAAADADAELLQLVASKRGRKGPRAGESIATAGERVYRETLGELTRGIKLRAATGDAWVQTVHATGATVWHNTDTKEVREESATASACAHSLCVCACAN